MVRLTVTHDGFAPGSRVLSAISEGWPVVLASLKTLLETGVPFPSAEIGGPARCSWSPGKD